MGLAGLFRSSTLKQPWKVPTSSVMNLRSLTVAEAPNERPLSLIPLAINPANWFLVDVLKRNSVNIQRMEDEGEYVECHFFQDPVFLIITISWIVECPYLWLETRTLNVMNGTVLSSSSSCSEDKHHTLNCLTNLESSCLMSISMKLRVIYLLTSTPSKKP